MYNTEKFIQKARLIHGEKYDYSKVVYAGSTTDVCIICPTHGEFWQRPVEHIRGKGCVKCGQVLCGAKQKQKAKEGFVERCKKIHGDKYTYEKAEYKDSHSNVIVTCKQHGDFEIKPYNILNGRGCPKCKSDNLHKAFSKSTLMFIEEARRIHGDLYDYSMCEYYNTHTEVTVICREHGAFKVKAGAHLHGCGCPLCNEPLGEKRIRLYLEKHGVSFIGQYSVNHNAHNYRVDFFVPSKNIIIEYNGEQHYRPIKQFGGAKKFHEQKQRDNNIRDYCKDNHIKLFEISYLQYQIIEQLLDAVFL